MPATAKKTDILQEQAEIREHLADVLKSSTFAASPRLREFLAFIVGKTLDGESDELKEYVIATTVYRRDATYDPPIDSTVRVEASRLRRCLQDFYAGDGGRCRIEIQLPRGRYVPVFVNRHIDVLPRPAARERRLAWIAVVAAILAGFILWQFSPRPDVHSVSATGCQRCSENRAATFAHSSDLRNG
jgi:hypothetical protein